MAETYSPRIYVACLASYNAGVLHGRWIDANPDADDLRAEIAAMLLASPEPDAEEWAIHDYDDFGDLNLGENPDLESVAMHARLIGEHGGAWPAYVNYVGAHYATEQGFEDSYRGEWASEQAYAEYLLDSVGTIPDDDSILARYFDYEKFTHDLFMSDYRSFDATGGTVYVFDANC